jgi:hypothetical protein
LVAVSFSDGAIQIMNLQSAWRGGWRWYRNPRRRRAGGKCQWSLHYPDSCGLALDGISKRFTRKQKGACDRR